jgi:lipopolysaccharide/colanic/teichoic acid biosynthesis glycosyltransferase
MRKNVYSTGSDVASRELLFIGFSGDFDAHILNFPYDDEAYVYHVVNQPFQALQWLETRVQRLESFQLPFAVLINLQWLYEDRFALVYQLAQHPDLCHVPIIALANANDTVDRNVLISKRIDDCYTIPVEWVLLEKRLEFLNQYKPRLRNATSKRRIESYGVPLPVGKRIFDIVTASLGLIITSPIWLSVVIAIRIESKGPIVYRSKRVGAGYRVFDFLKFRSMRVGADAQLGQIQHLNQYDGDEESTPVFVKIANDPRVTRVGRFIRKYSIDELPQLINVLKGDMSIVGNRPLPLYEASTLTRSVWSKRFMAPAGITGLWQVTKRGQSNMSAEERIALDVEYAENYCSMSDLRIIIKTFTAFIQKENV